MKLRFSQLVDSQADLFSHSRLKILSDEFDACLGAVVGLFCVNGNPYAWVAGDQNQGEMLLLADKWLTEQLRNSRISMKRFFE